jgi:hypothetical protein
MELKWTAQSKHLYTHIHNNVEWNVTMSGTNRDSGFSEFLGEKVNAPKGQYCFMVTVPFPQFSFWSKSISVNSLET